MSDNEFDEIIDRLAEATDGRAAEIMSEASGHTIIDARLIVIRIQKLGWELRPCDVWEDED